MHTGTYTHAHGHLHVLYQTNTYARTLVGTHAHVRVRSSLSLSVFLSGCLLSLYSYKTLEILKTRMLSFQHIKYCVFKSLTEGTDILRVICAFISFFIVGVFFRDNCVYKSPGNKIPQHRGDGETLLFSRVRAWRPPSYISMVSRCFYFATSNT